MGARRIPEERFVLTASALSRIQDRLRHHFVGPLQELMAKDELLTSDLGGRAISESLLASLCIARGDDPEREFFPCGGDKGNCGQRNLRIAIEVRRDSFHSSGAIVS
jgi:hypothetical protein